MCRKKLEDMLNDKLDKIIIDLRDWESYEKETFPGAVNIYYKEFDRHAGELPKNKRIYVFCYTGYTGAEIAEELSKKGYDIYSIEGGYQAILRWKVHNLIQNASSMENFQMRQNPYSRGKSQAQQNSYSRGKSQAQQNSYSRGKPQTQQNPYSRGKPQTIQKSDSMRYFR